MAIRQNSLDKGVFFDSIVRTYVVTEKDTNTVVAIIDSCNIEVDDRYDVYMLFEGEKDVD